MAQTLQLEYICTEAEMREAQTLALRKQLGGGSKWRTRLVLFLILVGVLLGLYFQMRQFPDRYGVYVVGGAFVFACVFVFWKNQRRKRPSIANKVEVSEREVIFKAGEVGATTLWSGFSDCLESPNLFVLIDRPKTSLMVLPKRAFPSESWQTWFRNLASNRPKYEQSSETNSPPPASSANRITLKFRLGLRDYVDRALSSYFTWGMVLGFAGLISGVAIYAGAHPPPHPVYSTAQVYFFFMLPMTFVMALMIIAIASVRPWFEHKKLLIPQEVVLSADSITSAAADGTGTIPWSTYRCYKETRWSFIIWKGQLWMLLPKRAFSSLEEMTRCRALLEANLRESRWFFG